MECANSGAAGQIEELKLFVSERLAAIASEIVGAIQRTITEYEAQAVRLKEENDRHRSLLDIILKTSLPAKTPADRFVKGAPVAKVTPPTISPPTAKGSPATKSAHVAKTSPASSCLQASDPRTAHAAETTSSNPSELKFLFTSCDDFLAYGKRAAGGECPYCMNTCLATEKHLMIRHFKGASHFILNGIENFVVPCMCKERIQGTRRSHWHCPLCHKTMVRKCNFDMHISKMHGITLLQNSQEAEIDQNPGNEQAPLSSDSWCQQELEGQGQEDQQAALFLHIKGEEGQDDEGADRTGARPGAGHAHYAQSDVCVGGYIQYNGVINAVDTGRPPSGSSIQLLAPQPDGGARVTSQLAEEARRPADNQAGKNSAPSAFKNLKSKRKKPLKRSLQPSKASKQPPANHNHAGPYVCKACGKTFHYMYTLRTHVQAHRLDKICGICGKHLAPAENLLQHLQSHKRKKKCGVCGKQFSDDARLKRHSAFHRPKGLNAVSSA